MGEGNKIGAPSWIGRMKGRVGGGHIEIEGGALFQMWVTFLNLIIYSSML